MLFLLANASARSAISVSERVQTRDTQIKGMLNFACATGAVLCGMACLIFIPGIVRFLAVGMTVIVAAIYANQGMQLFGEANQTLKAAELGVAGSVDDDDSEVDGEPAAEREVTDTAQQTG